MPLDIPNLDDRSWTELVEEARSLIPLVAPTWTDHNAHDPGITFLELFAWLAEMQLYQLNRLSRRHRETFAMLAGERRRGRTTARVDIRVEGSLNAAAFVAAGTKLTTIQPDGIVFETEADVLLTASRLQRVVVDDGLAPVDRPDANAKRGVAFLAFGEDAQSGASLKLGFDAFYPNHEPDIRLTVDVFTDDLQGRCDSRVAPQSDQSGATVSPVDLTWEYFGGSSWLALNVVDDTTYGFLRSGTITLSTPRGAVRDDDHVWIRGRIARGHYDIEPRLRSISLNVLPCVQRETVRNEELAAGSGRPDQQYRLAKRPVLVPDAASPRTVTSDQVADWALLTSKAAKTMPALANGLKATNASADEDRFAGYERIRSLNGQLGSAPESVPDDLGRLMGRDPVVVSVGGDVWERVESFDSSHPASRHFVFDEDESTILFGNGLNGRVPAAGEKVLAVWYQTTLGAQGNVAKDLRWRFLNADVFGVDLINPAPATGGADPEPLNELELRAQAVLRRPDRGVTLEDLENLALATPHANVARAKAIANCPLPETITVVAVPKVRPGRKGAPKTPSDTFLATVRSHLQRHRLLCDNLRVTGPVFVEVRVSARLTLTKGTGPEAAIERARQALDRFLVGDLQPGDRRSQPARQTARVPVTPCPTRWPFGRSVFPSEVYAVLDSVPGVDFASDLVLAAFRDGAAVGIDPGTNAIALPPVGLVYPGPHALTADGGGRGAR